MILTHQRRLLRTRLQPWRLVALAVVGICASAGIIIVLLARAAGPPAAFEAESGTASGSATVRSVVGSSGGSVATFGAGGEPDITVAIAGDIQKPTADLRYGLQTSDLIAQTIIPDYVLALGDLQYDSGTSSEFATYYSKSWGRAAIKNLTYPTPGNHEYNSNNAAPYYSYFAAVNNQINGKPVSGPAQLGYYAFDVGTNWRFYNMNSEANTTEQTAWLVADMAAHPKTCSLLFTHRPYWDFSTEHDGEATSTLPWLKTFYDNGGELVFTGHEHNYQRFVPVNPYTNQPDSARGLRSFVVGTGGTTNMYNTFGSTVNNAQNLITVSNGTTWGVLKLTLKPGNSYNWTFMPINGASFTDSGSGTCH